MKQLFLAFMAIMVMALVPFVAQAETAQQQADRILGSAGGGSKPSSSYTCDEEKVLGVDRKVDSLQARLFGPKKGVIAELKGKDEDFSKRIDALEREQRTLRTDHDTLQRDVNSLTKKVNEILDWADKNFTFIWNSLKEVQSAASTATWLGGLGIGLGLAAGIVVIFLGIRLGRTRDESRGNTQKQSETSEANAA